MKTKLILLVVSVAVVTLSFTFATVNKPSASKVASTSVTQNHSEPVGGLYADEVVE